ncbi:GlcNAc-transferase family protein [Massilia sp. W12]|uniref:GlcNAc-transferase family protein n=1 Tax=Massilia sp. W12 TaxID=3126507 RepID=UPI0030D58B92
MSTAPDASETDAVQSGRIFVAIAAYRDPDCRNTVRDLLQKAAHPSRVTIGVCLQIAPEDEDCRLDAEQAEFGARLQILSLHAEQSRGACWARNQVQSLYDGQDYYLQVDSHMRFVPEWDSKMIAMLHACASAKPILSTYPLAFTPPAEFAEEGIVHIHPKGFSEDGILAQRSTLSSLRHAADQPQAAWLIGAGLIFTKGEWAREVPYDPYLYFEGEEISLAVRSYTHGWDVFTPNAALAWHDYGKRPERARHWKDQADWSEMNRRSFARIAHMLQFKTCNNPDYLLESARYGLGQERSLAQFEAGSGIDFCARLYQGQPLPLSELAADTEQQARERRETFTTIWVNNAWRCPETRSGNGSSLAETVGLRQWLPEILKFLNCQVLADMGCGDLNWMQEIIPQLRFYFAYDIVPGLIGDLRHRFVSHNNCFFSEWDLVLQTPPQVDVILCRDVLTHLPLDAALMALRRFRASGAPYFMATTHNRGRNRWVASGSWYAMDLSAPPFNLPPPRLQLQEGGSKLLGVWAGSDLPEAP